VVLSFPDDIEAKAFLAHALIQSGWAEKFQSRVTINNLLLEVIQRSPLHPGAHHYRIHLWDNANFDAALDSALAYARSSPGIAHAWHMPGHIYNGLSRWSEASYQQEASARVDHAHLLRQGILPFEIHNYAHNQHYLIANLSHLGRARDAIEFSRNLIETPRDPQKNDKNGGAQRLGRISLLRIYVRYEHWVDLLTDPHLDWSDVPQEEAWNAYGRGLAQLGLGLLEKAKAEGEKLEKISAKASKTPGYDADLIETARLELRGKILVAEGKLLEGFDLLHRGAKLQVEKFRNDLAGYPRPFHEILGQVHLAAGDPGLAEACFREALSERKNMLVSLAGLAETCFREGKGSEAAEAYRLYARASHEADPGLACAKRLEGIAEALAARGFDALSPPGGEVLVARGGGGPGPGPAAQDHPVDAAPRADLEPLGPKLWAPGPAPDFTAKDPAGKDARLSDYRGKDVLLIFYLGAGCAACMEQVTAAGKEKEAFQALGLQILALSDDSPEKNREVLSGPQGGTLPLLLSDPEHRAAKLYGAFDTFEDLPLHGTVLIDSQGRIRWARFGAQPFKDFAFLRTEAARVNALSAPPKRVLGL
jgi:peroxiredoxin